MIGEELQSLPAPNGSAISIAYRFRPPTGNRPVFAWFCGFKSEMESQKARALSEWTKEHGAGCLRFDYSGHGQSGGTFEEGTISAWLDQAAAVCGLALSCGPTVFVGSSMGGWIALLLARRLALAEAGTGDRRPRHPDLLPKGRRDAVVPYPTSPSPLGERDGVRGDSQPHTGANLAAITLIAPAWDMTRLMWDSATEEARAAMIRDGVYHRPSAYGDAPYAITKTLIDDGENHLFGKGPVALSVPVRIIQGCQDADVPWRHSLDLLDVLESRDMRLTLIKDGEHRLSRPQDLALLFSTLAEFL